MPMRAPGRRCSRRACRIVTVTATADGYSARFLWSGYLLGVAVGGFFDGILLHQILQWHHLLSGLEGGAFADLRVQVLADGLFHALMYVVAAAGLWLLWQTRQEFADRGAGTLLFANILIGFGIWHMADSILSHWLLGIHRIRQDSPNPLLWDLIWFGAFGLIPILLGAMLRRHRGGPMTGRGTAWAGLVTLLVIGAGIIASLPPRGVSQVIVYFGPGATAEQVFSAAAATDARLVWSDVSGELWAFDVDDMGKSWQLYRHGALFVGNSFGAGCLAWSKAA
jgi:uncharacterized membrane protein